MTHFEKHFVILFWVQSKKKKKGMEISWPQFHYSTGISEILARHYRMVSCILNRLHLNVESQNLIFGKSESMKVLSVTAYDYFITTSAMRKECEHKSSSCWLDKQWNWAKSPKSLLPSAKINCHANLWICGLPASVATQPLETRLVLLKGIYR